MSGIRIHTSISDTTSITMTSNVHGRLAIRMSIVFLRVIFVTCSNREIYVDVYMAQAAAISAIMMNTIEKAPHLLPVLRPDHVI